MNLPSPERWLPIPNDASYEVSDLGGVRSLPRKILTSHGVTRRLRGRVLKPRVGPKGHRFVTIGDDRMHYVHVLVLEAFVGPAPGGMECCHWDDDPSNNRLENLRRGTRSDNMRDRVRNGRHPAQNRETCPLLHPLAAPNLVPHELRRRNGARSCLACGRARAKQHYWLNQKGIQIDLQATADAFYAEIIAGPKLVLVRLCIEETCSRKTLARGMCKMHYQIWWRAQGVEKRTEVAAWATRQVPNTQVKTRLP